MLNDESKVCWRPKIAHGQSIQRAWKFNRLIKFHTVFTLCWNGCIWTILDFELPDSKTETFDYFFYFFPLIGLLMAYHTLALWMNQTEVTFHSGELTVKKGPLPWRSPFRPVLVKDISGVFSQEYLAYTINESMDVFHYRVIVKLYSGEEVEIDTGMSKFVDAEYLKNWAEANIISDHKITKVS